MGGRGDGGPAVITGEAGVPRPCSLAKASSEGSVAVACLSGVCAILAHCASCVRVTCVLAAPLGRRVPVSARCILRLSGWAPTYVELLNLSDGRAHVSLYEMSLFTALL